MYSAHLFPNTFSASFWLTIDDRIGMLSAKCFLTDIEYPLTKGHCLCIAVLHMGNNVVLWPQDTFTGYQYLLRKKLCMLSLVLSD
jgi:hypothetical protein